MYVYAATILSKVELYLKSALLGGLMFEWHTDCIHILCSTVNNNKDE